MLPRPYKNDDSGRYKCCVSKKGFAGACWSVEGVMERVTVAGGGRGKKGESCTS